MLFGNGSRISAWPKLFLPPPLSCATLTLSFCRSISRNILPKTYVMAASSSPTSNEKSLAPSAPYAALALRLASLDNMHA